MSAVGAGAASMPCTWALAPHTILYNGRPCLHAEAQAQASRESPGEECLCGIRIGKCFLDRSLEAMTIRGRQKF